jgi:hypothetical protein
MYQSSWQEWLISCGYILFLVTISLLVITPKNKVK